MTSSHSLFEAAIADLEARRGVLGDAVVDAATDALRAQAATAVPASVAHGADIAYANGGAAAPPGDPRLRQVSVLFIDVAESTAMLQHLPAEAALPLISDALERFAAVVREQGGRGAALHR